jgi:hypothetical protein
MQTAPRYNRWQYSRVAPYLGRRICEIGSGIGNMPTLILGGAPELLVVTDTDPYSRKAQRHQFGGCHDVIVEELTLPDKTRDAAAGWARRGAASRVPEAVWITRP